VDVCDARSVPAFGGAAGATGGAIRTLHREPDAGIVDAFRRSVVLHQHPDSAALAVSALGILVLLPASYIYFKHAERTMADVV